MLFVIINNETYEIDSATGIAAADIAACEAGISELPVYSGSGEDGDDSVKTPLVFCAFNPNREEEA